MHKNVLLISIIFLLIAQIHIKACTIIAVGKKASADGSVIISHTDAGPDSRFFVVPRQTHKPGSKAPVYSDIQNAELPLHDDGEILGYIPQVEETYQYIQSAYSHVNEFQLGIGESTTVMREELACTKEDGEQIMTIEQAQIFALQRFKKAKPATRFIGNLMTQYGFLPSSGSDGSETLVVADTDEIWVFEVFSVGPGWKRDGGKPGAVWAAQRLPDSTATMIPNWSIIKEIDAADTNQFMVSENYMQEAIDRGWYDPTSGKAFIWQEAYTPLPVEFATGRFWLFHQTFAPNLREWPDRFLKGNPYKGLTPYFQIVEPLSIYPFSIKPEKKISVQDVIAFQRSTFEGTIYDMTAEPQWLVFDADSGFVKSPLATPFPGSELRKLLKITYRRPVARHRGHYGMVLQLRSWLPDAIGGVYWVYLDNPYFSPYVPIYAGNLSTDESYQIYNPNQYDEKSARWAIDFVDNLANLRFQDVAKDVQAVRAPFEEKMFNGQKSLEDEALSLYKKTPKKAKKYLTEYSNGLMRDVTDMFVGLRNEIITKYTNNHE